MKKFLSILISLIFLLTPSICFAEECDTITIPLFKQGYDEITIGEVYESNYMASDEELLELEEFLITQLENRKERIDIHSYGLSFNEFYNFMADFIYSHPELFYVSTGYEYSYINNTVYEYRPSYVHTKTEVSKYEAQIEKALELVEGMTDEFQIVLNLHSYLINSCEYPLDGTYDEDSDVYDAYDALINHCAVCQGYTLLFMDLLNRAGIDNTYAVSAPMNHIWNQVEIDGYWYNIDATWDDNGKDYSYFLKSDVEFSDDHFGYETPYDCSDNTYDSDIFYEDLESPIYVMDDGNYYYISSSYVVGGITYSNSEINLYSRTPEGVITNLGVLCDRNGKKTPSATDYGYIYNPFYYFEGFFYFSDGKKVGRIEYGGVTIEQSMVTLNTEKGMVYSFYENNGKLSAYISSTAVRYSVISSRYLDGETYYLIDYELNGGDNNESNPYDFKKDSVVTLYDPSKIGYNFEGWYLEPTFETKITEISGINENITIYAKWSLVQYTITYLNCDDKSIESYRDSYTIESIFYPLPTPIKEGYTFCGWYLDSEFTNRIYTIYTGDYGDKTLYAKWSIDTYTLEYYLDGGYFVDPLDYTTIIENPNPLSYSIETEFTFLDPVKPGYEFLGWYTEKSNGVKVLGIELGESNLSTLYAKWKEKTYTITYDLDGGKNNANNPTTYKISTSTFSLYEPTKLGSDFLGWYSDSEFSSLSRVYTINKGTIGDITLYALWGLKEYTITYYLNGGTNSEGNPLTYSYGDNILLQTPTRDGYTFLGWYTSNKYKTKATTISNTTGNKVYYAKWSKTKFTIKYNLNGGTNNKYNVSYFYIDTATITLKNPTRSGAKFKGWYTEPEYINQVTTIPKGSFSNITLYAKWDLIEYTITYNLNGGENSENNPSIYTVDTVYTLESPTREGYTFSGWYLDSKYKTKFTKLSKNTGNKTLYAKWTKTKFSIKYNLNGGTNNKYNPTYFYFDSKDIILKNPTRSGATFSGWYSDPEFTNPITTIYKGTLDNVTIYAKWDLIDYSITYNLNGGTNNIENPSVYNVETVFTLLSPVKEGYTFLGWYTSTSYKTKVTKLSKYTGNKTYYARWTPNTYSVKFNSNTGTGTMSVLQLTYNKDAYLTANAFTKTGYTFLGWGLEPNGEVVYQNKEKVKNLTTKKGDVITLYAIWEKTKYSITYKNLTSTEVETFGLPTSYYIDSETITFDTILNRTGYTFVGYYTSSAYKYKYTSIKKGQTGNKVVYVKWTPYKYQLHFNSNKGTGTMKNLTVNYGTATSITNTFKKTGYKLVGWSLNPDPVDDSEIFTKALNLTDVNGEVVEVYAIWERIEYTITYKNLNASEVESLGLPTSYNVESEDIILSDPTMIGYTFNGFYSDSKYKTKFTTIKSGSTGNKVIYVKRTPYKYQLHFNSNTGTGTMKNLIVSYGTATSITNTFKKTGYKLVGWSTDPEGTNVFTKALNLTDVNGEVVEVYAIWERIEYTITYKNLNASEVESLGLPTSYNVESEEIVLSNPTRTGKKFLGYYLDSKYKTKASTTIKTGSTGNKTYYVRWK